MNVLNKVRYLSLEMYFAIQDNAWGFWFPLQQILFIWYSNEKLLFEYIFLTIFHNCSIQWSNLWHLLEQVDKKK